MGKKAKAFQIYKYEVSSCRAEREAPMQAEITSRAGNPKMIITVINHIAIGFSP